MTLRDELEAVIVAINQQIDAVARYVGDRPVVGVESVYDAMDTNGRPLLTDLLVAKANALAALAQLERM